MKEYDINGVSLSKWTNTFLEECERLKGDDLYEDEIIEILDYMIGFVDVSEDMTGYAEQTLEYLSIEMEGASDDYDYDDEDEDDDY